MITFEERYNKVKNKIIRDLDGPFEELQEVCQIIQKTCQETFSTRKIKGTSCFSYILYNITNKEEKSYYYISERCIRRNNTIEHLKIVFKNNYELQEELEEAITLWDILTLCVIPLEILWCMEEEKEDDRTFNDFEQTIYNYLIKIANYYLAETEKYEKLYPEPKEIPRKILKK